MGLESATTIAELVITNPDGDDKLNQGDNHIRMVKDVLKLIFPGVGGLGFDEPILATETQLNFSQGLTGNIQDQLDNHEIRISANTSAIANILETGTKMMFYQNAAPTGWTIDTTVTDHMLRIVDGTTLEGGVTGGTSDPVDNTHTHTTGDHALTELEMPSHSHNAKVAGHFIQRLGGTLWQKIDYDGTGTQHYYASSTDPTGGGNAHNHGVTGEQTWVPRFANIILCEKSAPTPSP